MYVRKDDNAKKPEILSIFFITKQTQLNATHAQLVKKAIE